MIFEFIFRLISSHFIKIWFLLFVLNFFIVPWAKPPQEFGNVAIPIGTEASRPAPISEPSGYKVWKIVHDYLVNMQLMWCAAGFLCGLSTHSARLILASLGLAFLSVGFIVADSFQFQTG